METNEQRDLLNVLTGADERTPLPAGAKPYVDSALVEPRSGSPEHTWVGLFKAERRDPGIYWEDTAGRLRAYVSGQASVQVIFKSEGKEEDIRKAEAYLLLVQAR